VKTRCFSLAINLWLLGVLAAESRVPWESSGIQGSPDPPRPYLAEPVWPHVRFDKALDIAFLSSLEALFVVEQRGKIWSLPADLSQTRPQRRLSIDVSRHFEPFDSVFGMAFPPRFESTHEVFLCYRTHRKSEEGSRVSRFRMDPESLVIDPTSEESLLTFRAGGHNGGHLGFGPDRMLYILTGDAAGPTPPDPLRTGQDISDLLSSVLRIDVDRASPGRPYGIPPDNPFLEVPDARPEVWAYGFRNPWKLCFHPRTGDLWVGDVGWELWELLHKVERGGNHGWSILEGPQPVLPDQSFGPSPITPPAVAHPHTEMASITGGYVTESERLPDLQGAYLYGDFVTGQLWGLWHDGKRIQRHEFLADTRLPIVTFGQAARGEVVFLDWPDDTRLHRLVPHPHAGEPPSFPTRLSQTGLFEDTARQIPAPGVYPFEIQAPQWQDGAEADRWIAIPGTGTVEQPERGRFANIPSGTVLVKTIRLRGTKIETQILHDHQGAWEGSTFRWNPAQTDATLVPGPGETDRIGETLWTFPSRAECARCHNRGSDYRLAFHPGQLDRGDQLARFRSLGLVNAEFVARASRQRCVDPADETAPLELRARSWLQANCAHCHRRGGGQSTTLNMNLEAAREDMDLIGLPPRRGHFDLDDPHLIKPGDPSNSALFLRCMTTGSGRMPMLGSRQVDPMGTKLLHDWIRSLGPPPDRPVPDAPGTTTEALHLAHLLTTGRLSGKRRRRIVEAALESENRTIRDLFRRFAPSPKSLLKNSAAPRRSRRSSIRSSASPP